MSDAYEQAHAVPASHASGRAAFIKRTYLHLAAAVAAFLGLAAVLFSTGMAEDVIRDLFLANRFAWVGLMVLFIGGGYAAQVMARSHQSVGVQYAGLTLYVLLETLIFLPILYIATSPRFGGNVNLPVQAGVVTLAVFGGLTIAVFASGKDFSFLGPVLWVAAMLATAFVIAGAVWGFSGGLVFAVAMVGLAAGFIIYDTSNVIYRYGENEHVAAALALFASVALLFWYVLRIFLLSRDD